jgi:hypothetical protein
MDVDVMRGTESGRATRFGCEEGSVGQGIAHVRITHAIYSIYAVRTVLSLPHHILLV